MPDNGRLYTIAGTFNPLIGGIAYYTPLPSISYSFQQKVIVGSMPAGMTILPDGSRIYVANSDSNNVSVIDPATNTVLKTIEGFSTPVQAASHPNGKKVYITNKSGNSVSVIDTATDTVIKVIPVGQTPFGISVAPKIL
jgi:YVTN family beta-propeller protein